MDNNDELHYTLNGKKTSIYNVMRAYESYTPASRQRYKGLGEMGTGQLGESTLLPEKRTLIRYTMESAKDAINFVREYESNSKKILSLVGNVTRDDLLE
jgi:DNA gyrase/topoisomerase IV subunit B